MPEAPLLSPAGHRARLRARFEKTGFSGFAEHEILELLLTLALPRCDVKPLGRQLINHFGSLKAVLDAPIEALRAQKGMGSVAPVALHIIRDAAALYLQQGLEEAPILNSIEKLVNFWRVRLGGLIHEVFEVAFLDKKYGLIKNGVERLQEGDIDRAAVYPRRVLATALQKSAAAIVLAHNHPATEAYPSPEDRVLTNTLMEAASALGLVVVDHIIIGKNDDFSFRRAGLLNIGEASFAMAASP